MSSSNIHHPSSTVSRSRSTVLHIVPSYKPAYIYGGTITAISILAESQAALGHKIQVFTTTANGKEELPKGSTTIDGVQVQYFPRWTKDHTHFSPALLWKLFRSIKKYDTVHLHSWWNLVTIPALFICWLRGVRPFFSPHGMLSSYSLGNESGGAKGVFHRFFGRFLLSKSILHATAQQEAEEGLQMIANWKYILVPNIVELPERKNYRSEQAASPAFTLIFLSRIHHKKGLELLFEALSQVAFEFQLRIAGDGEAEYIQQLKQLAANLNIAEKIDWVGWINDEPKYQFLANADLFALTSHNENFAMVVIESLAVGTPVLLSDQVGLSDYVQEKQLGWICPLEVNKIQEYLQDIFKQKEALATIRSKAAEQIYRDFSAENIARQYVEAYRSS
ncbi:MAG: glycosyltransferase [Bacteroidota bacterium]